MEGEDNIESKKPIDGRYKMNLKRLRQLTEVFLSVIILMGCNNVEDNNPPPKNVGNIFYVIDLNPQYYRDTVWRGYRAKRIVIRWRV